MRKNKKVTQHKRAYHRRKKKILRKHKSESLKSTIITIPIVSVDSKITHPSEINPRRKRRKNGSGKMMLIRLVVKKKHFYSSTIWFPASPVLFLSTKKGDRRIFAIFVECWLMNFSKEIISIWV